MDRRTFIKYASTGVSAVAASSLVSKPSLANQVLHGRAVGRFSTPAKIRDLHGAEQSLFNDLWHTNLQAFTQQAICDPWAKTGMGHVLSYYDPTSSLSPGDPAGDGLLGRFSQPAEPVFRDANHVTRQSSQLAAEIYLGAGG
jgi:hypothetical protein